MAPAFYFRSRAFLHFHGSGDDLHADVRFSDEWEKVPTATAVQRRTLLERVDEHLALNRTRR